MKNKSLFCKVIFIFAILLAVIGVAACTAVIINNPTNIQIPAILSIMGPIFVIIACLGIIGEHYEKNREKRQEKNE